MIDHFGILMSLISLMWLAVIGVYVWTFAAQKDSNNKLGEIYKIINAHHENGAIHREANDFVSSRVCTVQHISLKENIDDIKAETNEIKKILKFCLQGQNR
jgi:hypothetical protein